jgi:Na+/proline symporter
MILRRGITLDDPELAFGYASRELLGSGLTGLMVACVLAANMSTCSNFMVNTGALFTLNVYKDFICPQADDRRLLWMGRLSGLALTILGVLFGLFVNEVLQAFLFTETIAALMGIMFFGGFMWQRANRHGALASALAAFTVYYGLNYAATGALKLVYKWQPDTFGWAMLAGFAALIVVSLLTKPEDAARIEKFFDNQHRSTDSDVLPQNGQKPLAANHGGDLLLLDAAGWFKPQRWTCFARRYREDLVGLALGYATVAALVGLAWALMQIGR